MANTTLLDLTQNILADLESDEVNTISETNEAVQIARIVRNTFYDIADEYYMESNKELLVLDGLGDVAKPTHLIIPAGVHSIDSIEYDVRELDADAPRYTRIMYLEPSDFIPTVNQYGNGDATVQVVTDFGGAKFQVRNDVDPLYYTSFDNKYVVFNSWNSGASTTVVGARTRAFATRQPTLDLSDEAVIDLPEHLISLLRAESTQMAFDLMKDGVPPSVARRANRQRVRAQRLKHSIKERRPIDGLPNYGRRV